MPRQPSARQRSRQVASPQSVVPDGIGRELRLFTARSAREVCRTRSSTQDFSQKAPKEKQRRSPMSSSKMLCRKPIRSKTERGNSFYYYLGARFRPLRLEHLEARRLLSLGSAIAQQLTTYQNDLDTAVSGANFLPIVGGASLRRSRSSTARARKSRPGSIKSASPTAPRLSRSRSATLWDPASSRSRRPAVA